MASMALRWTSSSSTRSTRAMARIPGTARIVRGEEGGTPALPRGYSIPRPRGGGGEGRNPGRRKGFQERGSMADPDAALMQAFQRGDESAFETLVDRHRERVFRL